MVWIDRSIDVGSLRSEENGGGLAFLAFEVACLWAIGLIRTEGLVVPRGLVAGVTFHGILYVRQWLFRKLQNILLSM